MNFGYALKVFQYNILRQSGISVTPQQVGLKSDPFAQYQQIPGMSSFNGVMQSLGGQTNTPALSPPTPPTDMTNMEAVTQYNQELLAYQRSTQAHNQQMMQLLLSRINAMQQSINLSNQQRKSSSLSDNTGSLGVGGILGGMSDA